MSVLLTTAFFPPLSWLALAARDMTLSPDRVLPSVVLLEACENYQKQSWRNRCCILAADGVQMLQVPVVHGGGREVRDASGNQDVRDERGVRNEQGVRNIRDARNIREVRNIRDARNIRDVRVDYSTPWVVRMQRALDTAYETSAYYAYYRDGLFALLDACPATLWDLNLSTLRWCLSKTGIACELAPTTSFAVPGAPPAGLDVSPAAGVSTVRTTSPAAGVSTARSSSLAAGVSTVHTPSPAALGAADDYRYVIHPKRPDTVLASLGLDRPYFQVFRDRLGGFTPGLSCLDLLFNEGPDAILWLKRL